MHETEVVFFDAAGTLFEVRGSVGRIYGAIALTYGVETDCDALDRAFVREFRAKSELGLACENRDRPAEEKRWWFDVVANVFGDTMPPECFRAYFEEVFEYFRTAQAWRLFPDTLASLKLLRQFGYRLGIISNFDSRLIDLLENLGISQFFEQVILSWHAGIAKPDPGIFKRGTDLMRIDPAKALHVGDSLEEDYYAAIRAGLKAILLDSRGRYDRRPDLARVSNLSNLCRVLGERRE